MNHIFIFGLILFILLCIIFSPSIKIESFTCEECNDKMSINALQSLVMQINNKVNDNSSQLKENTSQLKENTDKLNYLDKETKTIISGFNQIQEEESI